MKAVDQLIQMHGSQSRLARKLGLTPQAVQRWVRNGVVPRKWLDRLEDLTNGQISQQDLLADIKEVEKTRYI